MGWVLRRSTDRINPTLAGGVYGFFKTAGRGVFWYFDGARVRFVLFLADGGRYGLGDLTEVSYKKVPINPSDYKYHRGKLTAQISPGQIGSVNDSTNAFTRNNHLLANDTPVRFKSRGGTLPAPLVVTKKYFVVSATTNTFKVADTVGGATIDLTNAGSGTIHVWVANAGYDDPEQGLPFFCPQVETTFSGIAYIEGKLPGEYNQDQEPDWSDFRIGGMGRRLMDYDAAGNELGVVNSNVDLLTNPALIDADCLIVDYKKPLSRIDFPSWKQLRDASLVKVEQKPDFSVDGSGLIGSYFSFSGSVPVFDNAVFTRRDATIDFDFGGEIPAPELPNDYYSIRWDGWLKPKYTEVYTFKINHDDGVRLWVNGVLLIDQNAFGEHTATINLTADTPVQIKIEFWNVTMPGYIHLYWSSASQPEEIISVSAFYEPAAEVNRYQYSGAAATPIECGDYHEQILARCPGWDWTDENGKVVYLPPDRVPSFYFRFDFEDADSECTFIEKSFQKNKRQRVDRKNFALYSHRNQNLSYYPEEFVEENRPRIRELSGSSPNNDAPKDLMVMTKSLAQRMAKMDMTINSDPKETFSLTGGRATGVLTKRKLVRLRNWVKGDKRIADSFCLVRYIRRNGKTIEFELLPVPVPFYSDVTATVDGPGGGGGGGKDEEGDIKGGV